MATGTYAPDPVFTGFDDNGDPLVGGKLYTYAAGTTTPLATWPQVTLTPGFENSNPIILDSAGRATIFLSPTSYKFVLKTSADALVWSRDNIGAVPGTNIDNDVTGTAGVALTANEVAYLSDGSGGLTAGRWYKADADLAYASLTPQIGVVVADIAAGDSGTVRLSGRMTGFSGLSTGALYYISATAGAVTASAPTNARFVGQADSITSLIITANPSTQVSPLARIKTTNDFRLTLTTALPVTTADVTAAATLYWTPYVGNAVALYTGTVWTTLTSAQLSVAAPAQANQMYDVFVDYNDGTPALVLLAWTNDTTRATALTTQDGILVKTGDTQQRYVGSVRTVTASQFNDSYALRHVWNYYNRVNRPMRVLEPANSWNYNTAAFRQANANTANQLDVVVGVSEDYIAIGVEAIGTNSTGGVLFNVSIGEDSTSAAATNVLASQVSNMGSGEFTQLNARLLTIPAIGRHFYAWLEFSVNTGTTSFYGDNASPTLFQSGIHAQWRA